MTPALHDALYQAGMRQLQREKEFRDLELLMKATETLFSAKNIAEADRLIRLPLERAEVTH